MYVVSIVPLTLSEKLCTNPSPTPVLPPWLSGHKFDCRPFSGNLRSLPTHFWPSRLPSKQSHLHELLVLGCRCANFVILFSNQEGFMQPLLEMIIILYYQFPQLPACSLYVSTEFQVDAMVFIQTPVVLASSVKCWFILQFKCTLLFFMSVWNCAVYQIYFIFLWLRTSLWMITQFHFSVDLQIQACHYHGHLHFPACVHQYHSSSVPWWLAAGELPQCHSVLSLQWQACSWRNR